MRAAVCCPTRPSRFADAERAFAAMEMFLDSAEADALKHSDLERALEAQARELIRKLLQAHLDARAPARAVEPVRDAAGVTRTAGHVHTRELETLFGTVTVTRVGYGAEGEGSLHPLDGQLNLPVEKYSHELRRRVALEAAKGACDDSGEKLASHTGAHVPKRQFEELVVRAAQDFDAFYQARHTRAEAAPATGSILVLTVDGKGVVMRPEDLREATQKAAAARATTFTARLGRGRRLHAKRMASVAAVYTIEPFRRTPDEIFPPAGQPPTAAARPVPEHKRVWASLKQTPGDVITAMFDEAQHRDPRHRKQWVALVDGNEPQIDLISKQAAARHVAMPIVLDFIHVAEYVWKASRAFAADQQARDAWVLPRLREILRGKASDVAAGMRRSATLRGLAAEDRTPVDVCADYLLKYAPYLHYHLALTHGAPIATGVIEGACGHLIEDRMNLTGARWSLNGAEAVLRLRALRSSGDFDEYWRFHERAEYERNHAALYADHRVPTTARPRASAPRSRRNLTLVKKPESHSS
jgi:hypothetical protein